MVSGHSPASSAQVGTTLCDLDTHLSVHWLNSHHVPKHDCCLHSEGGRHKSSQAPGPGTQDLVKVCPQDS